MKLLRLTMAAAALALLLAARADAMVLDGNCRVQLEFLDNGQATFVVVTVIPPRAMEIDADVRIVVNGQLVKVEPILARALTRVVAPAGPTGATLRACAEVGGLLRTSTDRLAPADARACDTRNPEITETLPPRALELASPGSPSLPQGRLVRAPGDVNVRQR